MQISLDALQKWTTPTYYQEGKSWFEADKVEHFTEKEGQFEGRISIRDRSQITRFKVDAQGRPDSNCPCRINRQEGMICGHIIAVMLAWRAENADPMAERAERIDKSQEIEPERRRHFRKLGAGGVDAKLHLNLRRNWLQELMKDEVFVVPAIEVEGRIRRPDQLHPGQVLKLSKADQRMLALLEDVCGQKLPPVFPVKGADLAQIFQFRSPEGFKIMDWPTPLSLHEKAVLPMLTVDLDRKSGELMLNLQMDLPKPPPAGSSPLLALAPTFGWVISGENAWPLEAVPPAELQGLCSGPIRIPREKVMSFLKEQLPELEQKMLVDNRVGLDSFSESQITPPFHLRLKGGLQFVSGVLHARYGEVEVLACGPDSDRICALPDPENPLGYGGRNLQAEEIALTKLRNLGFEASSGDRLGTVEGQTPILNLLSTVRYDLEPQGWEIELTGNLEEVANRAGMLLARMDFKESDTPEWFRMELTLRDHLGDSITEGALRKALDKGEDYLKVGDRFVLLPRKQTEAIVDAVREAKPAADGSLQVPKRACGYIQSLLEKDSGIPVSQDDAWMAEAASQNQEVTLEPVDLRPELAKILRPYQDSGIRWLRLLEKGGYGGILGDDMGLGKTLQTLAWLSLERIKPESQGMPALVVCPSSLVENWSEEAQKFLPGIRVLPIMGSKRAPLWKRIEEVDLVILSYGMLRRDLKYAEPVQWAALVLDEAQHIKNPGTKNALAAKKLQAGAKVVLTGTPVENQVRDLWSLMDFLMPGYLGSESDFKKRFGTLIGSGGPGAATAMNVLRKKLKPFLLRRLKQDVAKDLPPRLERRVYCDLSPVQQKLYDDVKAAVQADAESGKSKLAVLQGLMKLRQICGHPALLTGEPAEIAHSGKLESFLELLNEVIDGGHRVLVFSQFTSMLGILKTVLSEKEIDYLYLDGGTKNRQELVHKFNDTPEIPVFLISLKAGGTGLNLTGADVVIHFDPWWNPAVEDQATDRAHRIGQEKTVYAMKLISRNTVEAQVARMQDQKREIIEAALEGDEAVMNSLSWDDVKGLLEL
ncbi:DEAD/DEAH box helicase [Kiritimatiellota bacterium B12222]|nr:DEAD/DEAH box helicase [Kiritimatiellota bacterium B12222]